MFQLLIRMDIIQEREKIFRKEVKIFSEEVKNKLNVSFSELNELYRENKKYNFSVNEMILEKHNENDYPNTNLDENFILNNNDNNALMNSLELKNKNIGAIKSKVKINFK